MKEVSMKNFIASLVVLVLLSLLLVGCGPVQAASSMDRFKPTPSPTPSPTPVFINQSLNLVHGLITVPAGNYYYQSFRMLDAMRSPHVSGNFTVNGSGLDIKAYILSEQAYTNFMNGNVIISNYSSGRLATDNINISLSMPGLYYLLFDNSYSVLTSKQISASVDLVWSQQVQ
jgi:hypothetical protein